MALQGDRHRKVSGKSISKERFGCVLMGWCTSPCFLRIPERKKSGRQSMDGDSLAEKRSLTICTNSCYIYIHTIRFIYSHRLHPIYLGILCVGLREQHM